MGTDRTGEDPRGAHAVDRMLGLLSPLGIPAQTDLQLFLSASAHHEAKLAGSQSIDSGGIPRLAPTTRGRPNAGHLSVGWRWDKPLVVPAWWLVLRRSSEPCCPGKRLGILGPFGRGDLSLGGTMGLVAGAARLVGLDSAPLAYGIRLRRGGLGVVWPHRSGPDRTVAGSGAPFVPPAFRPMCVTVTPMIDGCVSCRWTWSQPTGRNPHDAAPAVAWFRFPQRRAMLQQAGYGHGPSSPLG